MSTVDALHDAPEHATLAAFIASDGDAEVTDEALLDAEIAALGIDPDSEVGKALEVIFGEIRQAAGAVT